MSEQVVFPDNDCIGVIRVLPRGEPLYSDKPTADQQIVIVGFRDTRGEAGHKKILEVQKAIGSVAVDGYYIGGVPTASDHYSYDKSITSMARFAISSEPIKMRQLLSLLEITGVISPEEKAAAMGAFNLHTRIAALSSKSQNFIGGEGI